MKFEDVKQNHLFELVDGDQIFMCVKVGKSMFRQLEQFQDGKWSWYPSPEKLQHADGFFGEIITTHGEWNGFIQF